jgi:imidazolonepropionase
VILIRGADEAFTLSLAAQKKGIRPNQRDLGLIKKPILVLNRLGRFEFVGSMCNLPKPLLRQIKKETVLSGGVLLPGWVECHTHSAFLGNRSFELDLRNQGKSYQSISQKGGGILSTVRLMRKASVKTIANQTLIHTKRFISQGVTTLEIKSGYGLNVKEELKILNAIQSIQAKCPIEIVPTFLGAHSKSPDFNSFENYLTELTQNLEKFRTSAHRIDIFIESGFFEPSISKPFLKKAQELGFDVTIHADQLSHSGGSQLGINLGAKSIDHVIHISPQEITKLSKSSTVAVLLPIADLYLKCPYPPARKLIDQGCRVALSTDFNPGTSPTQSLGLLGALARIEMKMSTSEVLTALTVNAAQALGRLPDIGSLEVGKLGNFQV